MRVILLLCALALAGCAYTGEYTKVFGDSGVITANGGGDPVVFERAAKDVRATARQVRIDGQCDSACALFADLARPNVCITDRAVFGFHKATKTTTWSEVQQFRGVPIGMVRSRVYTARIDPPHTKDIAQWVNEHGGFPEYGVLHMKADEAAKFWPRCR